MLRIEIAARTGVACMELLSAMSRTKHKSKPIGYEYWTARPSKGLREPGRYTTAWLGSWVECTDDYERQQGGERWIRRIDPKCWISALYRRTGFGCMEWETAIVFLLEEGSRAKRWESDDRDCLIIGGDRREELATMPKEQLRQWYEDNINGNRNSMETLLHAARA